MLIPPSRGSCCKVSFPRTQQNGASRFEPRPYRSQSRRSQPRGHAASFCFFNSFNAYNWRNIKFIVFAGIFWMQNNKVIVSLPSNLDVGAISWLVVTVRQNYWHYNNICCFCRSNACDTPRQTSL